MRWQRSPLPLSLYGHHITEFENPHRKSTPSPNDLQTHTFTQSLLRPAATKSYYAESAPAMRAWACSYTRPAA